MSTKGVLDTADVRMRLDGAVSGTIIGRFSVFNEIDSEGDRTRRGSFKRAIDHLEQSGVKLPLIYHHQTSQASSLIGVVDELWEAKDGAWFKARLDLGNVQAQGLHRILLLNPAAVGVSYGFGLPPNGTKRAADGATDLLTVYPLLEISLTPTPALDHARVVGAKSRTRTQTLAEQLMVQFEATAARGGFRSLDPVYDFSGLVKKLDNDVVYQWDQLLRKMSAKTAESTAGTAQSADDGSNGNEYGGVVEADYAATRCRCGKYLTSTVYPPVSGGSVQWQLCGDCGTIRSFIPVKMTEARADSEHRLILSKVVIEDSWVTKATGFVPVHPASTPVADVFVTVHPPKTGTLQAEAEKFVAETKQFLAQNRARADRDKADVEMKRRRKAAARKEIAAMEHVLESAKPDAADGFDSVSWGEGPPPLTDAQLGI